jgi:hypothetical protein
MKASSVTLRPGSTATRWVPWADLHAPVFLDGVRGDLARGVYTDPAGGRTLFRDYGNISAGRMAGAYKIFLTTGEATSRRDRFTNR